MKGKFEKLIAQTNTGDQTKLEVLDMVETSAKEFPCSTCQSKEGCESYKWFVKWFGKIPKQK